MRKTIHTLSGTDFKVRASAAYKITTGFYAGGLTEKQQGELDKLYAKDAGLVLHGSTKKPLDLTDKDRIKMGALIEKRDQKPKLSEGAKTYLKTWIQEQLYGRRKEFSSKYTEKGNTVELAAIHYLRDELNKGQFFDRYRGKRKEDADFTGTCDVEEPKDIWDIKAAYTCFSHPLFDEDLKTKIYQDQGQVYMELYDKPRACFAYVLMTLPEELIEHEAYVEARKLGLRDYNEEIYNKVAAYHTYDDLPAHLRIKTFWIERDEKRIEVIRKCVEMSRNYIDELLDQIRSGSVDAQTALAA